jgi:hypothetical protein
VERFRRVLQVIDNAVEINVRPCAFLSHSRSLFAGDLYLASFAGIAAEERE